MTDPHAVLLSVRPRYVGAILNGTKTVELRRTSMRLRPGAKILIYSSSPTRQLVAEAVLGRIDDDEPAALWGRVAQYAGVTRREFDSYFAAAGRAFGLHLQDVVRLPDPIDLASLRAVLGHAPPQSFRYLTASQAVSIRTSAA